MSDSALLLAAGFILLMGLVLASAAMWQIKRAPAATQTPDLVREAAMAERIDALLTQIGIMAQNREEDRRKIESLGRENVQMRTQLEMTQQALGEANRRIEQLEARLTRNEHQQPGHGEAALPDLLCLFGPDPQIVARDKAGLQAAQVDYESITGATRERVADEMAARREDRRKVRWLHIGAHADERGIALLNTAGQPEIVEPEWWRQMLDGVEVLLLAMCQGTKLSTALFGLAEAVVYFREGVDNEAAGKFTGLFWGNVTCGMSVQTAYQAARKQAPAVRDFVALRVRQRENA